MKEKWEFWMRTKFKWELIKAVIFLLATALLHTPPIGQLLQSGEISPYVCGDILMSSSESSPWTYVIMFIVPTLDSKLP